MNNTDLVSTYRQLADITQEALLATRSRDWERYAQLQEREDRLVQSLKNHGALPLDGSVLLIASLIQDVLSMQKETAALIALQQGEIVDELNNTVSSKLLTQAYRGAGKHE